jgi:rubrerythrin
MTEELIKIANKNQFLKLLYNDLLNEYKHMLFYTYHAGVVAGIHREEYKELFLEEAKGEMNHVLEFTQVILGLGGNLPYLIEEQSHESSILGNNLLKSVKIADFPRMTDPKDIISYAIEMEKEVVSNYVKRIKDAELMLDDVDAKYLEIFLEDQVKKSREDVDNFSRFLK